MPKAKPPVAALLAFALLAFAPSAAAEEIVPPGNSAASQYTEAFPTAGGERETEGRKQGRAVPADVLGSGNSRKLESKGEEGKAVAEFAAETAPVDESTAPVDGDGAASESDRSGGGAGSGGGKGGSGGSSTTGGGSQPAAGPAQGGAEQPSGSSGVGEVVGQMTGSSSGELGLWLPLIVIGAVAWSLFYLWRQRQRVA